MSHSKDDNHSYIYKYYNLCPLAKYESLEGRHKLIIESKDIHNKVIFLILRSANLKTIQIFTRMLHTRLRLIAKVR